MVRRPHHGARGCHRRVWPAAEGRRSPRGARGERGRRWRAAWRRRGGSRATARIVMRELMKRYRFLLPLLGLVVLAVVLAVGIVHSPDKDVIPSPLIGKAAPDFSAPNLMDGAPPVSTSLLKGHWSLVNVWGSWCDSCRAE